MDPTPRWLALLFVAVGCLVLVILVFDIWSTRRFVRNASRADGVVIELNAGTAHPQVEFSLASGEKVSFPANGFISYGLGKHAKVLYLPDDPYTSARLDDFGDLWTGKIVQGVVGYVFLVVGGLSLGSRRRPRGAPSANAYPALAELLGGWFHQDFDIEGETLAEVVEAYKRSTPAPTQVAVRRDIDRFLSDHPQADRLEASFEETFHPDIIASAFSGSTRGFLEQIRDLLPGA